MVLPISLKNISKRDRLLWHIMARLLIDYRISQRGILQLIKVKSLFK